MKEGSQPNATQDDAFTEQFQFYHVNAERPPRSTVNDSTSELRQAGGPSPVHEELSEDVPQLIDQSLLCDKNNGSKCYTDVPVTNTKPYPETPFTSFKCPDLARAAADTNKCVDIKKHGVAPPEGHMYPGNQSRDSAKAEPSRNLHTEDTPVSNRTAMSGVVASHSVGAQQKESSGTSHIAQPSSRSDPTFFPNSEKDTSKGYHDNPWKVSDEALGSAARLPDTSVEASPVGVSEVVCAINRLTATVKQSLGNLQSAVERVTACLEKASFP